MFGKRSRGGAHVPHYKNTASAQSLVLPPPDKVVLPMSQHIGATCTPTVKVGDEVLVGSVIGDSEAFVSAPIHASVSGKVTGIADIVMPAGNRVPAVTITSDGQMTPLETLAPPIVTTKEELVQAARDCGLVGLGGAGFPTHVKMSPKNLDDIDTVIVNGAECEPFITSDHRAFLEDTDDFVLALDTTARLLGIENIVIGIEKNKPDAIALMHERYKNNPKVRVLALPASYPMGAEKVIILEATGRIVPEGKLPGDVNVLVFNVTTLVTLGRYLRTGVPLVTKRLTIDGSAVTSPCNVIVPIGTPIDEIMQFCGGYKEKPQKILMGGPMMGISLYTDDYPVLKNNNAVLALTKKDTPEQVTTSCIRCGKCVAACPMRLMPVSLERAYELGDVDALARCKVNHCIECGTCAFVCPARRKLVANIKLGKQLLRQSAPKS